MDRSLRLREMMMMGGWRWCAKDNSEGEGGKRVVVKMRTEKEKKPRRDR
jgi:hypothetical protein